MSHAALATRYRPQTFADVTGQDTVKGILSRAAAEDKVAPAYLLSGTRGVGKTTIARIFAKALNCAHAPAAEPCNQCEACRAITQGSFVDVVEIDGASNRGIDDARRLRDAIGYAPMEGRYKVFIIDEAHMLTKEAFNALLKTLEEPPAHATFILATTEPHKFPVTIVSRCQHFIFKALSESELCAHLIKVLGREEVPFEDAAVHLIARRAAGSVRDGMSLLGQTLALGGDTLTEAATRSVLGLAGQELYERLLLAMQAQDCAAVSRLTAELLEAGADIGFFLRELALLWRNMFLIRQAGAAALPLIDLPEAEKGRLANIAAGFELTAIHAAWQLTLDGQRQVLTSLEPGAALELLLLNLALTPSLASLELISRAQTAQERAAHNPPAPRSGEKPQDTPSAGAGETGRAVPMMSVPGRSAAVPARPAATESVSTTPLQVSAEAAAPRPETVVRGAPSAAPRPEFAPQVHPVPDLRPAPARETAPAAPAVAAPRAEHTPTGAGLARSAQPGPIGQVVSEPVRPVPAVPASSQERPAPGAPGWPCAWKAFLDFCAPRLNGETALHLAQLQQTPGACTEAGLELRPASLVLHDILADPARQTRLRELAQACAGRPVPVLLHRPAWNGGPEGGLKQAMENHAAVRLLKEHFDATLLRCTAVRPPDSAEQ